MLKPLKILPTSQKSTTLTLSDLGDGLRLVLYMSDLIQPHSCKKNIKTSTQENHDIFLGK